MGMVRLPPVEARKPRRPRAIPKVLEPVVVELYIRGYGYRAIASILRQESGINPHFSSVRQTLMQLEIIKKRVPSS